MEEERERMAEKALDFDEHMKAQRKKSMEQLQKDIAQFGQYGLDIDNSIIKRPFARLERNAPRMAELANRRYSITDPQLRAILKLDEGAEKEKAFRNFGQTVLQEGIQKYYDRFFFMRIVVFLPLSAARLNSESKAGLRTSSSIPKPLKTLLYKRQSRSWKWR